MREVSDPTVNYEDYAVPVLLGGTAAATLTQAANNLKLVQTSQVGQANGPVGLDATGKIDASKFSGISGTNAANVQGNFAQPINTTANFVITDYDSFKSYTVSVSAGSFTRNGDTIAFTAPGTAQSVTMTINGRALTIAVQGIQPAKPTLAAVDQAGSAASTAALVLTGSAFAMNTTSANTHLNTDWQVASDANFNSIVTQSLTDATNKTTWTSGNLSLSTTYYARVRYRDNTSTVGDWSNTLVITTKASYVLNSEQAQLAPTVKNTSASFGWAMALSADGNRMVIGATGDKNVNNFGSGCAYVFLRVGSAWSQEAKFEAVPTMVGNNNFGYSVGISSDASRVCVGSPSDSNATPPVGAVHVYLRTGTTWALEQRISDPAPTSTAGSGGDPASYFGSSCMMDYAGTRIIAGAYGNDSGGVNQGRAHVMVRSGVTWSLEQSIACPAGIATDFSVTGAQNLFGRFVAICGDGTRIGVSTLGYVSGSSDMRICIFSRSGSVWSFEQYITFASNNAYLQIAFDGTGTRCAVGRSDETINFSSDGAVYIYSRSGSVWTQEQKLSISVNSTSNNRFGYSIALNSAGNSIAILRPNDNNASYGGALYNYIRSGVTWTLNKKLNGSTMVSQIANAAALSSDGTTAAIGYPSSSVSGTACGSAFIFTY